MVTEGLIITLGVFSFIEIMSIYAAVGSGLEGDLTALKMFDTFSYVGFWGYMIVNVVIAFHIKNSHKFETTVEGETKELWKFKETALPKIKPVPMKQALDKWPTSRLYCDKVDLCWPVKGSVILK